MCGRLRLAYLLSQLRQICKKTCSREVPRLSRRGSRTVINLKTKLSIMIRYPSKIREQLAHLRCPRYLSREGPSTPYRIQPRSRIRLAIDLRRSSLRTILWEFTSTVRIISRQQVAGLKSRMICHRCLLGGRA